VTRRNWLLLGLLSLLWGAAYLVIAVALRGFPPVVVVFGRASVAALLLLPLALRTGALRPLARHPWWTLATVLVQATAPLLLLTYGQQRLSTGLTGILIGAQPLFVAVLALVFAPEERPRGGRGHGGLLLGFAGITMLFGFDLHGSAQLRSGAALVTGAALCYAAGTILIHRKLAFAPPLGVATAAMLVASAVLAVPGVLSLPDRWPATSSVVALLALGTIFTALTLNLFYGLIARAGPGTAALAFYLSPGVAVGLGWLLLDEHVSWSTIAGLLAVVGGSVLAAGRSGGAAPE
jgi:drug/metabolite transporter (DMT)-like permease